MVAVLSFLLPLIGVQVYTRTSEIVDYGACATDQGASVDCVVDTALADANRVGVGAAMKTLKLAIRADRALLSGCHGLAHELGNAFHVSFGDKAVTDDVRWCSYGYVHGLMTAIGNENPQSLVPLSEQLCRKIDRELTKVCLHGIGHAAMVMTDSLPDSMGYCEQIAQDDARNSCAQAVVMEITMSSPTGQLPAQLDAQTCNELADETVAGGCAVAMSGELVIRGLSMGSACGSYSKASVAEQCRYGFGAGLANSHLSGLRSEVAVDQRGQCSANKDCSEGFGMAALLWIGDDEGAYAACSDLLGMAASTACRYGVDRANRFESGLW